MSPRTLVLAAALAAAAPQLASAQAETHGFDLPTADLAIFGLQISLDYLAPPVGTIVETRADLQYTSGGLDAAQLEFLVQAPTQSVPIWTFTGADLGWSGTGSFQADISTSALDGIIDLGDPAPGASLFLVVIRTTTGVPLNGQLAASSIQVDIDPWIDLDHGLAGTGGLVPALDPTASLAQGSPFQLDLVDALPGSTAFVVLGLSPLSAPFKGGVLVPHPDLFVPVPVGPGGSLSLSATWPGGVPGGLSIYLQCWIQDPGGPAGLAASNAVRATTA
jgi:hypothetical protein